MCKLQTGRGCWIGLVMCVGSAMVSWCTTVPAQEISGLQAALAMEKLLVESIQRSERSVVAIARAKVAQEDRLLNPDFIPNEYASGVVVDRKGLILTSYRALGDVKGSSYAVWIARRGYRARILAADPYSDLAVLEVRGIATELAPITFGDSGKLKKGQVVISLGNPHAIARDGEPSATWGIISNLARKAPPIPEEPGENGRKETLHHYGTLIQTDARLHKGTGGGALINLKGDMIGLTTALPAVAGYEAAAGFAIPVDDTFKRVVGVLKQGRAPEYGFLGVAPGNFSFARLRGETGVPLSDVVWGTPAARADLKKGDIITQIGGKRLWTADDLMLHVGRHGVGETVDVVFRRNQREYVRKVSLSKKYLLSERPVIATNKSPAWRGMRVDHSTATLRFRHLSHNVDPDGCVVVTEVETDSPAWKAGFRPDDFISHVGGRSVTSPQRFASLVRGRTGSVVLTVSARFAEDGKFRTVKP